eukprot:TRINITY_DN17092_c0_g1_i5.p2 TRINITY_DN17092_c0_g1~~TRINITY_DN17092_c0_g1_i5.p2  ORF type:complete len:113 (+),score=12.67 TRINITY_DN17092_c0_g1_i5:189-527(+)
MVLTPEKEGNFVLAKMVSVFDGFELIPKCLQLVVVGDCQLGNLHLEALVYFVQFCILIFSEVFRLKLFLLERVNLLLIFFNFLPMYSALIPCLLYTSPSPRDLSTSRMPSSA